MEQKNVGSSKEYNHKISNIFSGEGAKEIKESQRRHIKPKEDNIIFNDNYIEKNPNIQEWRKKRYAMEEKMKNEATYFDDMKKPKDTYAFKRKLNDNYKNNPLKIYNNDEIKQFNENERQKYSQKEKVYKNVFGSDNCKRTLGGIKRKFDIKNEKFNSDKINNNNFNINKNAIILNKDENQQVPYYGKRHFAFANTSSGKGMSYF